MKYTENSSYLSFLRSILFSHNNTAFSVIYKKRSPPSQYLLNSNRRPLMLMIQVFRRNELCVLRTEVIKCQHRNIIKLRGIFYKVVDISENPMTVQKEFNLPYAVAPGGTAVLSIYMTAPSMLGNYTESFQIQDAYGAVFGKFDYYMSVGDFSYITAIPTLTATITPTYYSAEGITATPDSQDGGNASARTTGRAPPGGRIPAAGQNRR